LQDVKDEITGKSTPIMERVRKETIQPGSVVKSLVSAGSICNIGECPVTLLRFPDDEEDFRDSSFSVFDWLVLQLFETETGIGSSTPVYVGADILPHAVVIPCVKEELLNMSICVCVEISKARHHFCHSAEAIVQCSIFQLVRRQPAMSIKIRVAYNTRVTCRMDSLSTAMDERKGIRRELLRRKFRVSWSTPLYIPHYELF
jgi:hypothetical protein